MPRLAQPVKGVLPLIRADDETLLLPGSTHVVTDDACWRTCCARSRTSLRRSLGIAGRDRHRVTSES